MNCTIWRNTSMSEPFSASSVSAIVAVVIVFPLVRLLGRTSTLSGTHNGHPKTDGPTELQAASGYALRALQFGQ